jgi:hypothetical protein
MTADRLLVPSLLNRSLYHKHTILNFTDTCLEVVKCQVADLSLQALEIHLAPRLAMILLLDMEVTGCWSRWTY